MDFFKAVVYYVRNYYQRIGHIMMKNKSFFAALALSCIAINSYANCGTLQLEVSNETSKKCILKKFQLNHGNYEWYPLATILPGQTDVFDVDMFGFGPDVELSYSCGGRLVSFRSQMNRAVFIGKTPTSEVIQQDAPLEVSHHDLYGSCVKETPGIVMWVIHDTDINI